MTRKTKSGEPDQRHGGYRHGVPGGSLAKERVEVRVTPDVKERWRAAAERHGFTGERDFAAAVIEFVETGIKALGLEKPA
jgi:hypothetical protein